MEIYLKGKKIGYSMHRTSRLEEDYLILEETRLKLNLMGQANLINTLTHCVVDQDLFLKSFRFKMISGIVHFQVAGRVQGERLIVETGEGGAKQTHTINLSGPVVIGAGIPQFFRGRPLELGKQ